MTYRTAIMTALTLVFLLTLGSFALEDVVLGIVISALLLILFRRVLLPAKMPDGEFVLHILIYSPRFLLLLAGDVLRGTWQVTGYVIGRKQLDHPGIVAVPLGNHSRPGSGIVGLLVTLSPGSFLLDIDWERRVMLIHVIDASDPDGVRADVEKYYKLWEYGTHIPMQMDDPARMSEVE